MCFFRFNLQYLDLVEKLIVFYGWLYKFLSSLEFSKEHFVIFKGNKSDFYTNIFT